MAKMNYNRPIFKTNTWNIGDSLSNKLEQRANKILRSADNKSSNSKKTKSMKYTDHSSNYRVITNKFNNKCKLCGNPLEKGVIVRFHQSENKISCNKDCSKPKAPSDPPIDKKENNGGLRNEVERAKQTPLISKIDRLKIISILGEFSELCDKAGVRFGKFTDEELLGILHLYRDYRNSGKAPF